MKLLSHLHDPRIKADNYLFEMSAREYLDLARAIIANNEFQRRRVKSSNTIYSLLKDDLRTGCVIPPLVLALMTEGIELNDETIQNVIIRNKEHLVILDGLQRTNTLIDIEDEMRGALSFGPSPVLQNLTLRVEFYIGVNRLGILYRMLTLNTGQTPMSLRQQVEMLYLDFANIEIEGIRLIREAEDARPERVGEYNFKVIIEGFNSYIERNELPIDRLDILDNIKGLESLSRENRDEDLFCAYLKAFHRFIVHMYEIGDDIEFSSETLRISGQPYGSRVPDIFMKSAAVSGFGAAVGKLRGFGLIQGFDSITQVIPRVNASNGVEEAISDLLGWLEELRLKSKKIGNAQRMFFQFYFRELFNPSGDSYLDLKMAADNAYQKYISQAS